MNILRRAGEILYPHTRCVACGAEKGLAQGLCLDCAGYLDKFRLDICQDAASDPGRAYRSAYGAFAYRGCVREIIHVAKFSGETRPALAYLVPAMTELVEVLQWSGRVIVPVPLSRERMLERGYNQSALLAAAVAKLTGCKLEQGWLWRNRSTKRQMSLEKEEREKNVLGAFSARSAAKGASIVLIDDVLTSGATASSCAHALLGAGAASVDVLAASRAAHFALEEKER